MGLFGSFFLLRVSKKKEKMLQKERATRKKKNTTIEKVSTPVITPVQFSFFFHENLPQKPFHFPFGISTKLFEKREK